MDGSVFILSFIITSYDGLPSTERRYEVCPPVIRLLVFLLNHHRVSVRAYEL